MPQNSHVISYYKPALFVPLPAPTATASQPPLKSNAGKASKSVLAAVMRGPPARPGPGCTVTINGGERRIWPMHAMCGWGLWYAHDARAGVDVSVE